MTHPHSFSWLPMGTALRAALSGAVFAGAAFAAQACGSTPTEPTSPPAERQNNPGGVPWAAGHDADARKSRDVLPEPKSYDQPIDPGSDPALTETRRSGSCQGNVPDALEAELQKRAGDTSSCYEKLLEREPGVGGQVQVNLIIGQDGNPTRVILARNTLVDDNFGSCVRQIFEAPLETPPEDGCVSVALPLNFTPEQAQDGKASAAPGAGAEAE